VGAVLLAASVISTGCFPFFELGAGTNGTVLGVALPIPIPPAPFSYRAADATWESWFGELTLNIVDGSSWQCSMTAFGAGRATRYYWLPGASYWRGWAAGLAFIDVTGDEDPLSSSETVGVYGDLILYGFKWGGLKLRLLLAPDAEGENVSGVMLTYVFGYEPFKSFSDFMDWLLFSK